MELKEGMYVRTKDGVITKIEQIVDDEIHFNIKPIFSDGECLGYNWFYIKDVVKASNNIIYLIEVGDYVNGYYVTTGSKSGGCSLGSIYIAEIDGLGLHKKIYEKDIKSIVTKEQFESMSYKVEE